MPSAVMLSVIMLNVVMLSVIMLNVVAPCDDDPEKCECTKKSRKLNFSFFEQGFSFGGFLKLFYSIPGRSKSSLVIFKEPTLAKKNFCPGTKFEDGEILVLFKKGNFISFCQIW